MFVYIFLEWQCRTFYSRRQLMIFLPISVRRCYGPAWVWISSLLQADSLHWYAARASMFFWNARPSNHGPLCMRTVYLMCTAQQTGDMIWCTLSWQVSSLCHSSKTFCVITISGLWLSIPRIRLYFTADIRRRCEGEVLPAVDLMKRVDGSHNLVLTLGKSMRAIN